MDQYYEDVLQEIPEEDLPKLRDLYKNYDPSVCYIYNYLNNAIRWKKLRPDKNFITLFALHGNWKNGTFISLHQYGCYELHMFTLERNCKSLIEGIMKTKRINWKKNVTLYAIYIDFYPSIKMALEQTPFILDNATLSDIVWMPRETALTLEFKCPPEVFIDKLKPDHADIVNSVWPMRYEGSEKYISTIIEVNGGYGVFLKSNGKLVAWGLRNVIGLGAMQTDEKYMRRGYGSLVVKVLAKEIAKEGYDPVGTIKIENYRSKAMFAKIGFHAVGTVVYMESYELRKDWAY